MSILWMIMGRKMYNYNKTIPRIFGLSVFPLVAWTVGLFVLSIIYYSLMTLFTKITAIMIILPLYWALLIAAEYVGYHVFSLHNVEAAKYPPLPLFNCLHAPTWMKIVYFSMGPIMILFLALL